MLPAEMKPMHWQKNRNKFYLYNMQYNLAELIQLPVEERIKIIEALEESLIAEEEVVYGIEEDEESDEVIALLEDRLAKIESGEHKTHPAEEVEARILQYIQERNRK